MPKSLAIQYKSQHLTVVKTGQLSGTCSVQRFKLQKWHMAVSTLKNNSNNNIDLATCIWQVIYKSFWNCWRSVL